MCNITSGDWVRSSPPTPPCAGRPVRLSILCVPSHNITMPKILGLSALLAAGYAVALASATTFTVGDEQGWTMGADYISWIKGKTFAVGDKLGEYVAALLIHAWLSRNRARASVILQLRAHPFGTPCAFDHCSVQLP